MAQRLLFGDGSSELIDDLVLVANDVVEVLAPEGRTNQIIAVELIEGIGGGCDIGIDRSPAQTIADGLDLPGEDVGLGLRLSGLGFRRLDGLRRRSDLGLLKSDVGIERLERLDKLQILRRQGVELGGCVGCLAADVLSLAPEIVDGVLGQGTGNGEAEHEAQEQHSDRSAESAANEHAAIVT